MRVAENDEATWKVEPPYGYAEAVNMAGSVAAPLLAGFAVSLVGIVIATSNSIRWPGVALLLLAGAAAVLLLAVQAAFIARTWQVTPSELEDWWPNHDDEAYWSAIRAWQAEHQANHKRWARLFRCSYNLGLVLVLLGVAATLAPPSGRPTTERWFAVGIMVLAAGVETIWAFGNWGGAAGDSDAERPGRRPDPTGLT